MTTLVAGMGGALRRGLSGIGAMLVGMFAGLTVLALGTKALVLAPIIAFAAYMATIPYIPLLSIVFTIPINVEIAGPITVSRLIIIFAFFVAILQALRGIMPRFTIPYPEGTIPLIFFVWTFFIALVIPGGSLLSRLGPYIIHGSIFFVVLSYTDSIDRMRSVFIALVVTGFGQGCIALAEALFNFAPFGGWHAELAEGRGEEVRVVATSSHPIVLAGFFQIVIACIVMFLLTIKDRFWWLVLVVILGLCLASWWFTYARSSWIGMLAMIMAAMILSSRATRTLALIGGSIGFLLLATHDFSPSAVIDTIESLATLQSASTTAGVTAGSESLSWRTENWAAAIGMWADHPLTGVGIDQSNAYMARYLPRAALAHQFISTAAPHNLFLMIGAEGGWPAFILFVIMWISSAYGVVRAWPDEELRPYTIAIMVIIVGHLGTFFFNPLAREAFLVIAMSLALTRIARLRREAAADAANAQANAVPARA